MELRSQKLLLRAEPTPQPSQDSLEPPLGLQSQKPPARTRGIESHQSHLVSRQCPGPGYSNPRYSLPLEALKGWVMRDHRRVSLEKDFPGHSLPGWDDSNTKTKATSGLIPNLWAWAQTWDLSLWLGSLFPPQNLGKGMKKLGLGNKRNKSIK